MKWSEWKSLWRFEKTVDIPHLSVTVMFPWAFARLCWYFNRREFQAWPSEYETSLVLGWRWPFTKTFREKKWATVEKLPLAVYGGPMDEVYLARAIDELHWPMELEKPVLDAAVSHIGPTVKDILQMVPRCNHNFWLADCPDCARKALRMSISYKTKYNPVRLIDPHEDPRVAFRRREAEAKKRLGVPE